MGKIIKLGLLVIVVFVGYTVLFGETLPPKPGENKFDVANKLIFSDSEGSFHGNTPAAKDCAKRFSELMETMQKLAFKGGKKNRTISLTDEKFLTYCNLSKEGVCFLIHVPQLKNYKDEVRDSLIKMSWTVAKLVTKDLSKEAPIKLGLGLRGSIFYGGLAIGASDKDPKTENAYSVAEEKLFPFFAAKDVSGKVLTAEEQSKDKKLNVEKKEAEKKKAS